MEENEGQHITSSSIKEIGSIHDLVFQHYQQNYQVRISDSYQFLEVKGNYATSAAFESIRSYYETRSNRFDRSV